MQTEAPVAPLRMTNSFVLGLFYGFLPVHTYFALSFITY